MSDDTRLPPQFIEGERAILGACFVDNSAVSRVAEALTPDDFYREAHRQIFQTMLNLYKANQSIDYVTMTAALRSANVLDTVGGVDYLAKLVDAVPSAANVMHYANLVRFSSSQRLIIRACAEASQEIRTADDITGVIGQLEQVCYDVLNRDQRSKPISMADLTREIGAKFTTPANKRESNGIKTNLTKLDNLTGGLQPTDLIIICGRPRMGKSALAADIALAASEQCLTLFFSLEMSREQKYARFLSKLAGISVDNILRGHLSPRDIGRLVTAQGSLSECKNLIIDETAALTPTEIQSRTQNVAVKHGKPVGLVVIDYIQLVRPERRERTRDLELGGISSRLKAMAKTMHCPVIALCQLNRRVEERPLDSRQPQLADLRESGNLEQDTDVIIGVHRRWPYTHRDEDEHHAEICVIKQRNGPEGRFKAYWDGRTATFKNLATRDDEPTSNDTDPPF